MAAPRAKSPEELLRVWRKKHAATGFSRWLASHQRAAQGDLHHQRIESLNSVIRKFTRNRKIYPYEDSAPTLVFMAIREASRKWTTPINNWKQALSHFAILFEGRIPELSRDQ